MCSQTESNCHHQVRNLVLYPLSYGSQLRLYYTGEERIYPTIMTRKFSAGGTVYRIKDRTVLWLITKPRPSAAFPKDRYTLPKGEVEGGEKTEAAALREVEEETGINAKILSKVDYGKSLYAVDGEKIFKITTYFLMKYVSGQEKETPEVEKIYWLSLPEARNLLSYSTEKKILQKASELIQLGS